MLKANNRLHRNRDIRRVIQKGVRLSGGYTRITYLYGNRRGFPRLTVIVSTKIAKHAVDRNHLKRHLRVAMQLYVDSATAIPVDVVVQVVRSGETKAIVQEVTSLLSRIGESRR